VTSRTFPLREIEDGEKLTMTDIPDPTPIREYLDLQRRFAHFTAEQVSSFEEDVARQWCKYEEWAERSSRRG
jgi:pyruvate ferredoxin oxidoreductase beta subunit